MKNREKGNIPGFSKYQDLVITTYPVLGSYIRNLLVIGDW